MYRLDGDHLGAPGGTDALAALAAGLRRAEDEATQAGELWDDWWAQVLAEPVLRAQVEDRQRRRPDGPPHHGLTEPRFEDYLQALTAAGFREVGELWRRYDDVVLAALR